MEIKIYPIKYQTSHVDAFFIKGDDVRYWLSELDRLDIEARWVKLFAVPGKKANTISGCFVIFTSPVNTTLISGHIVFKRYKTHLFIPVNSSVSPKLEKDEVENLFPNQTAFYPDFGYVELVEEVDWNSIIQFGTKHIADPVKIIEGPKKRTQIKGFRLQLPVLEEAEIEKSLEIESKPLSDKLSWLEQLKLKSLGLLFSARVNKDMEFTVQKNWWSRWFSSSDKMEGDYKRLFERNQNQIDKLLQLFKTNPKLAMQFAKQLDMNGTSRGSKQAELNFLGSGNGLFSFLQGAFGKLGSLFSFNRNSSKSENTSSSTSSYTPKRHSMSGGGGSGIGFFTFIRNVIGKLFSMFSFNKRSTKSSSSGYSTASYSTPKGHTTMFSGSSNTKPKDESNKGTLAVILFILFWFMLIISERFFESKVMGFIIWLIILFVVIMVTTLKEKPSKGNKSPISNLKGKPSGGNKLPISNGSISYTATTNYRRPMYSTPKYSPSSGGLGRFKNGGLFLIGCSYLFYQMGSSGVGGAFDWKKAVAFLLILFIILVLGTFGFSALGLGLRKLFGGSGSIFTDGDRMEALRRAYIEQAKAFEEKGEYKEAAKIYINLLKDYLSGANALKEGKHYQEAAHIYKTYCNNIREAAWCYEQGHQYEKAIELYVELKNWNAVGCIYQTLDKPEDAKTYFLKDINEKLAEKEYIKAARIYQDHLKDNQGYLDVLKKGWIEKVQSVDCLKLYMEYHLEDALDEEIKTFYKEHTNSENSVVFLKYIKTLRNTNEKVQKTTRHIAYEIVSELIKTRKGAIHQLDDFNTGDSEFKKDILRFKQKK